MASLATRNADKVRPEEVTAAHRRADALVEDRLSVPARISDVDPKLIIMLTSLPGQIIGLQRAA